MPEHIRDALLCTAIENDAHRVVGFFREFVDPDIRSTSVGNSALAHEQPNRVGGRQVLPVRGMQPVRYGSDLSEGGFSQPVNAHHGFLHLRRKYSRIRLSPAFDLFEADLDPRQRLARAGMELTGDSAPFLFDLDKNASAGGPGAG
jgi:hypothetical protein